MVPVFVSSRPTLVNALPEGIPERRIFSGSIEKKSPKTIPGIHMISGTVIPRGCSQARKAEPVPEVP